MQQNLFIFFLYPTRITGIARVRFLRQKRRGAGIRWRPDTGLPLLGPHFTNNRPCFSSPVNRACPCITNKTAVIVWFVKDDGRAVREQADCLWVITHQCLVTIIAARFSPDHRATGRHQRFTGITSSIFF